VRFYNTTCIYNPKYVGNRLHIDVSLYTRNIPPTGSLPIAYILQRSFPLYI
jgi:hypothetical protein